MRTVDITIEDHSFAELDAVSRAAGLTPAEFARRATAAAVRLHKGRDATRRDASGYATQPVQDDEFTVAEEDLARVDDEAWWGVSSYREFGRIPASASPEETHA